MGEPQNKWGELDEFPVVGKFHVRHAIDRARDTGYLFGKNFDTLFDAIEFAERQINVPRVLVYAGDDRWLTFEPPFDFRFYYVPGSEEVAEKVEEPAWGLTGSCRTDASGQSSVEWFRASDGLLRSYPSGFNPNTGTYQSLDLPKEAA